jgi:outer membrane protein OmpA-like peptidoglycan-associated protein
LLSVAVLSGSILAQPSTAAEGDAEPRRDRSVPAVDEPANPESEPLEDRNKKANPDSEPAKDRSKKANPESEPTKDRSKEANPESEPTKDRSKEANPESKPLEESEEKKETEAATEDDAKEDKDSKPAEKKGREKRGTEARKGKEPVTPAREGKPSKDTLPKPPGKMKPGEKPDEAPDPEPTPDPEITPDKEKEKPERPGRAERDRPAKPEAPPEMTSETAPESISDTNLKEPSPPPTEEAKQAEAEVQRATAEVETKIAERKLRIEDKGQAESLIEDILGKASPLSRAEVSREQRSGLRRPAREDRPGREAVTEVSREQRRAASEFLRNRLRGEAEAREAPEFFRREAGRQDGDRRDGRPDPRARDRAPERVAPPRYLHEGRRYVHFDSRASVPAILLATVALDRLRMQPARELNPVFFSGDQVADALPPAEYRGDDAWVVSYPVNEKSMISSNDILFRQGSTQFADGHSYDMLQVLSDAMNDPALSSARFVIEGHASAEGSYDENMALSQRRAEAIVREMVRGGIPPERLIPVGYGEGEARHRDNAPEALRAQDRRVVVFRMDDTPVAGR